MAGGCAAPLKLCPSREGPQGEERFACPGWLSQSFLLKNRRKRAGSTGELCFFAHYGRRGCEPSLTDGRGNLAIALLGDSPLGAGESGVREGLPCSGPQWLLCGARGGLGDALLAVTQSAPRQL